MQIHSGTTRCPSWRSEALKNPRPVAELIARDLDEAKLAVVAAVSFRKNDSAIMPSIDKSQGEALSLLSIALRASPQGSLLLKKRSVTVLASTEIPMVATARPPLLRVPAGSTST